MVKTFNKAHIAAQSDKQIVITDFESVIIVNEEGTVYIPSPYLHHQDQEGQCRFGAAVALNENAIYVGAPLAVGPGATPHKGSVHVYEAAWPHRVETTIQAPKGLYYFGRAIALNDDYIFIAASRNKDSGHDKGAVLVYNIRTLQWLHTIEEVVVDGETHSNFGGNLEVYQEYIAIEVASTTHRYNLGTWELLP